MEKTKLLTLLVVCLVALNLGILAYLFFGSEKPPRPGRVMRPSPKEIVINKLNFDDKQLEKYEELIKGHRAKITAAEERNMQLKNSLYQYLLSDAENKMAADSIIQLLGENQQLIEKVHFNHFKDIKKICNPYQLESFEELANELSEIFSPPRMRRKND